MPRMHPIKTKLIPDYRIPWELEHVEKTLPIRVEKPFEIFDIKKYI